MTLQNYFKDIEDKIHQEHNLATEARKKGLDPRRHVEIDLATNIAERAVGLVSLKHPQVKGSNIDKRIQELHFSVKITVPNILDGSGLSHSETFSGLSELALYVSAIEWLIKYREENPKISKFWVNKF